MRTCHCCSLKVQYIQVVLILSIDLLPCPSMTHFRLMEDFGLSQALEFVSARPETIKHNVLTSWGGVQHHIPTIEVVIDSVPSNVKLAVADAHRDGLTNQVVIWSSACSYLWYLPSFRQEQKAIISKQ